MVTKRLRAAYRLLTAGTSLQAQMRLYLELIEITNDLVDHMEERAIEVGEAGTLLAFQKLVDEKLKYVDDGNK